MPNIKSAKKRLLTSAKANLRNRVRKSRVKTFERQFAEKLAAKDLDGARETFKMLCASLDKAAKVGSIHQNKANRRKSRLLAALKKAA